MLYNPGPAIYVSSYQLPIRGLAEKPQVLPLEQLRGFPQETQSSRMKCVQCWSARTSWSGFRFHRLLEIVKPRAAAKAVRVDCADKWYEYFAVQDLLAARVLLALDMAGNPLPDKHGAPLR